MATPNTPAFITQIVDQCIDYTGDIFDRGITVDPTPQLSGRAPANSPVYIYDGGKLIGSAKADGSGNWSFTPDRELGTGLHALTVMAHGKMSEPLIITVEASGASTGRPVITSVVDNQGDSGQVEHGATISDKSPTLSGTAAPNAYVEIFSSGRSVGVVQANAEGHWSITPTLSEGLNILSVKSQGQYSEIFTLNIETATTVKPTIENVYDNLGESGLVGEGAITDDNTPTVSGNARPGAIVQLYANGREVGRTQADSNGNWSIITSALENGQQVLKVASEGQFSDSYIIDVQVPAEVGEPIRPAIEYVYDDFGSDVGQRYSGDTIDDRSPVLAGTAGPHAIVQIYSNGQLIHTLQANDTGYWGFTAWLPYGEHTLTAVVGGVSSEPFDLTIVDPLQEPVADEYSHALSLDNVLADSHLDVFGETVAPVAELDPVQTLRLMDAFLSEAGHAPSGNVAGFTCMAFTPELLLPVEELLQPPL